jgi:hypothetical protein
MGSMNLVLPVVGVTPGTAWATLLNTALSPNIEEHDHSSGKGLYIKTTGAGSVGLNVNGDMNFQDIDPTSPGFNSYNRPINLMSTQFIAGTTAGTFPVADNLNLMTNDIDLWFRDGTGALIQLTSGGSPLGEGRRYAFQVGYDSLTASSGWASYNVGFKNYNFASDTATSSDTVLLVNGVCQSSDVAWSWASEVLGVGVAGETLVGSVRIGYMPELAAPDPASYSYPDLWVAEIVPQGDSGIQNGFRIQGDLMAAPGVNYGPGHLDLTAHGINPAVGSYWRGTSGTTTPQIQTGDGVIAYRGNPASLSPTTDLFISGSYNVRGFWFYDGIKLPGLGGIELHVNGGYNLAPSQVDIIPKPSTPCVLNLHDRDSNKVVSFNGADASLWRYSGTNGEFQIKQAGTGDMTLRTGASADVGVGIDDAQTVTLGNATTTPVNAIGNLRVGYEDATGADALVQIGYGRDVPAIPLDGNSTLEFYTNGSSGAKQASIEREAGANANLVIDNFGTGKLQLTNAGTGSFEVRVNGGIGLAVNNAQATSCYGDLRAGASDSTGGNALMQIGYDRTVADGNSILEFYTNASSIFKQASMERASGGNGTLSIIQQGIGDVLMSTPATPAAPSPTTQRSGVTFDGDSMNGPKVAGEALVSIHNTIIATGTFVLDVTNLRLAPSAASFGFDSAGTWPGSDPSCNVTEHSIGDWEIEMEYTLGAHPQVQVTPYLDPNDATGASVMNDMVTCTGALQDGAALTYPPAYAQKKSIWVQMRLYDGISLNKHAMPLCVTVIGVRT